MSNHQNLSEFFLGNLGKTGIGARPEETGPNSGGPDSMALAYLLNEMNTVSGKHNVSVQPFAFIVNHKARRESTDEANYVQSQLRRLKPRLRSQGIESEILEIQWPNNIDPANTADFELRARRARYRLIADAAIRKKIHHLFLGHHQDDQVETVLMRLVRNAGTSFLGFQGMSEHSTIPCCEDIRGANEIESYERFARWLNPHDPRVNPETMNSRLINQGKTVTPSVPGGLRIHRPLLSFAKSAIIDFCNTNHVPHVQDKTNYDPTLTLRNAVRYMRTHYTLPKALQRPSILSLQQSSWRFATSLAARGEKILEKLRVLTFDLRSGRMTVRVSPAFISLCELDSEAGAYALARLTSVVSSQSRDEEPTLVPRHNLRQFLDKNRSRLREWVTVQQVLLEKSSTGLDVSEHTATSGFRMERQSGFSESFSDYEGTVWTLSRPPLRLAEITRTSRSFSLDIRPGKVGNEGAGPILQLECAKNCNQTGFWSQWMLWDHRYWVRVRTKTAETLSHIRIRTYCESDVQSVYTRLKDRGSELQSILAEAGPGKLRFTIPVLTVDGQVSVFPTLNVVVGGKDSMHVDSGLADHSILEWEVCYKVIDLPIINDHREMIHWMNAQVKRHK
ncbi:cell cycle protein MesJ [Fonsecaea pedrosoi]|nr:cell cycle protein MesJ [Fonsecaea pedrosoi]